MNKKIIIPALAATVVTLGVFGAQMVSAQTADSSQKTTIIQKIAQKFGLQESEVQAVFDQDRAEHMAEMEKRYEENLSQLVTDGKITESQKTEILAKHKEMVAEHDANHEAMKNMTAEERKAAMDKKKQEMEAWAKEKGIDLQYLMPGKGMGGKGMRGWGMGPMGGWMRR